MTLSKRRQENPRRSSITKGGVAVKVEDGTDEGIQFTIPWNDVGQACMRNNAKPVPRQKQRNKGDMERYLIRQAVKTIVSGLNDIGMSARI